MQDYIIQIIDQYGYGGIMLLIAIENLFPPIPSEVILTFGGFLTTHTNLNAPGVIAAATLGSMTGAIVLYGVGRLLSPEKFEHIIDGRLGKALHFRKADVARAESWFSRRGASTVFLCRFIPIVRSLISIPAGMTKMPFGKFLIFSAAGTLIWNTVLVMLGIWAGSSWEKIVAYTSVYSKLAILTLAVLLMAFGLYYYKKRIKRNK